MIRTFHPVGQGGFYTERFFDVTTKQSFTVAYDIGTSTKDSKKILKAAIDSIGNVDVIFISHLHEDHINGLPLLLKKNPKLKIIMPVLDLNKQLDAALYNGISSDGKFLVHDEDSLCQEYKINSNAIITIDESEETPSDEEKSIEVAKGEKVKSKLFYEKGDWLYIQYNPSNNSNNIVTAITKNSDSQINSLVQNGEIDDEALRNAFSSKKNYKKLKDIYEKEFKGEHNSYSMAVYSGPRNEVLNCAILSGELESFLPFIMPTIENCDNFVHCLYTGDSEIKTGCNKLVGFYNNFWDKIRIIQEPHHGSKENYNKYLNCSSDGQTIVAARLFVISVGLYNQFGHPSVDVINDICGNGGFWAIVHEKSTPLVFKYEMSKSEQS